MKSLQEHLRSCKRQVQKEVPDCGCLCEYCPKMFGRLSDLSRHITRVHNLVPKNLQQPVHHGKDTTASSVDELGLDLEIELEAEDVKKQDKVMLEAEISRKPTQLDPVFRGKKRKLCRGAI